MSGLEVDAALPAGKPVDQREAAARAEAAGYGGVWAAEVKHDPFLALTLAATVTERVDLGTSIAVAFAGLGGGHPAGVRGGVLHPHADDADVRARPARVRAAADPARRRGGGDDGGGGRGRRRLLRLHARLPPGPGAPRPRRPRHGAPRAVPAGRVGADGRPGRRRAGARRRRRRRAGTPELLRRYGDLFTRCTLYAPHRGDPTLFDEIARRVRAGSVVDA